MYRISDIPLQDLFANSPQIYKELKNLIFIDEGKKTTYIDAVRQIDSLLASSDSKKRKYGEAAMAYLASPFVQIYNKYYSRKDNPANE